MLNLKQLIMIKLKWIENIQAAGITSDEMFTVIICYDNEHVWHDKIFFFCH